MPEIVRPLKHFARSSIDVAHRHLIHPYLTRGKGSEDREIAHERAMEKAEWAQNNEVAMKLLHRLFVYEDPILQTEFAGVRTPNPLGIAAGFDKNAHIHRFLGEGQGFGIVTVGSLTKIPYEGNAGQRIFDLPESDGLINRMGFPGRGVDEAEKLLMKDEPNARDYRLVINLAASRPSFERGTAIKDYVDAAKQLLPYGEIHEINVSSPNTPGVRSLQDPGVFAELAAGIEEAYRGEDGKPIKPYIFKFSPDLPVNVLEQDLRTTLDRKGAGVSLTNTTTDPEIVKSLSLEDTYRGETGGISGSPLRKKALLLSNRVYEYTGGQLPIKRAGGIQTAEDIWNAMTFGGATITDVYTAYVRPRTSTLNFTHHILSEFAGAMRRVGMDSMRDFEGLRGEQVPYPIIK